jgi:uncharacterized peroxidase-related enzyme
MPRIDIPEGTPGPMGPLNQYPDLAEAMIRLDEQIMRGDSPLSPGERELIASFVSARNDCTWCTRTHSAVAAKLLEGGMSLVEEVRHDYQNAPISDKMKALLRVAGQVQEGGGRVTDEAVDQARSAGATDREIHDAVLVAADFSKWNRYVDALQVVTPDDPAVYDRVADSLLESYKGALGESE